MSENRNARGHGHGSDAPLGENNLSIDQFDPYTRTGLLLPVKVISAP